MKSAATATAEITAITVSDYASQIGKAVRHVGGAVVEGEVQKPRRSSRGMLYFDLTDGDAKLSCKVFDRQVKRLAHEPKEGDLVRATVERPDFWATAGKLDLIVAELELAGEGELLRRRARLLARLRAEGLCDPDRYKPLPAFPRAVGVIAGKGSDGMSDVVQAIRDRFPPAHIVTCNALVQGKSAPRDLIDALARLQAHPLVDVIVMARGGGSVQDLIAFDDERLCRAIFACDLPVVAAIGHTDNVPVCNHVTHAAFTPSRSAEMVVPSIVELRHVLAHARQALDRVPERIEHRLEQVQGLRERLHAGISRQLADHEGDYRRAIDRLVTAVETAVLRRLEDELERVVRASQLAWERIARRVEGAEREFQHVKALIAARDFRQRGFVLATDAAGLPVPSVAGLEVGARLTLNFRDGQVEAAVDKIKEEKL